MRKRISHVNSILLTSMVTLLPFAILVSTEGKASNLSWAFCEQTPKPTWLAVQNGDGPWTQIIPNGMTYEFEITEKGAVASVRKSTSFAINPGLNDAWFNPDTAGQGFLLTVFPDIQQMFLAWFTYEVERPPENVTATLGEPGHRWLTAQGPFDGRTAILDVFVTEGGVFDSGEPPPTSSPDGTLIVEFTDCNSGTITYDIPSIDRQGVIPIRRIVNDNVALCESLNPTSFVTTEVKHATTEWFESFGKGFCVGTGLLKTVHGSIAGLEGTDQALVSLGDQLDVISLATSTNFTLEHVHDVSQDLLAVRYKVQSSEDESTMTPIKGIIRRDVDPADGATMPVLDFGAAQAFDFATGNLTVENLGGDTMGFGGTLYFMKNVTADFLEGPTLTNDNTLTFKSIPLSQQAETDLHSLVVVAFAGFPNLFSETREGVVIFKDGSIPQTIDLGPALGPVTVTVTGEAEAPLIRWQYTRQPEYDKRYFLSAIQFGGSTPVGFLVNITDSFRGDSDIDYTLPDFRGVEGWNPDWGLSVGELTGIPGTSWSFAAIEFDNLIATHLVDGQKFRLGQRGGIVTP